MIPEIEKELELTKHEGAIFGRMILLTVFILDKHYAIADIGNQ